MSEEQLAELYLVVLENYKPATPDSYDPSYAPKVEAETP